MADDFITTQRNARNQGVGFKGREAGKDAAYTDRARATKRQEYDNEMGWGGIAGAGKKPKDPDYTKGFEAWHQKKYGKPAPGTVVAAPKPPAGKAISSSDAAEALEKRVTPKDEED